MPISTPITGGCLCSALRYVAHTPPDYAGFCCCGDCRKASGAGAIAFMGFSAAALRITGLTRQTRTQSARGTISVRNTCATCASLVFGGIWGADTQHTIYAGSLDNPAHFQPTIAIFTRDRPAWVELPAGLTLFEAHPK
jgi:hypothetical protein